MRITVTERDIEDADDWESEECPIEIALRRATGKSWCVNFEASGKVTVRLRSKDRKGMRLILPDEAATFARQFAQDRDLVDPIEFEFDEPCPHTLALLDVTTRRTGKLGRAGR